jgi:general secretion pathway protein D
MTGQLRNSLLAAAVSLIATACTGTISQHPGPGTVTGGGSSSVRTTPSASAASGAVEPLSSETIAPRVEPFTQRGTGRVVGDAAVADRSATPGGDITLNFDSTPIEDVVAIILGDYLEAAFTVDPAVQGEVTWRSSHGLSRDDLLPLLETLLASRGAALVTDDGGYRVVPLEQARTFAGTDIFDQEAEVDSGYRSIVIPLKFISAADMAEIVASYGIQPIVNADRNVLIVSGTAGQIRQIRQLVRTFDVNWLQGMSFALHPLLYADASEVERELNTIFAMERGEETDGAARIVSIERLNALLVIAPHPELLEEYERWIKRLDRVSGKGGRSLYVYHVQNGRAEDLARALSDVFLSRYVDGWSDRIAGGDEPGYRETATTMPDEPVEPETTQDRLRIIADPASNALLIRADQQDYAVIEAALRRLDVEPMQVLIEASIIEVNLTDELRYGLEWLVRGRTDDYTGDAILDFDSPGLNAITPGFSYVLRKADEVRLAINALAEDAQVNVLSSPALMVLNNQTATIRVGDEVPIPTRQSVSNIDPDAPTVNEVEYRSTGVLLSVTPRLNTNGLVTMDVDQEVSNVAETTSSDIDAPTFLQRRITSSVAINSGETVVLGGLIRDQQSNTESGIPVLHRLPIVGKLFGTTSRSARRTELIVLITPRGVHEPKDMRAITDEYQRKMMGLMPAMEHASDP